MPLPKTVDIVHFKEGGVMIVGAVVNSLDSTRHVAEISKVSGGVMFTMKGKEFFVPDSHIKSIEFKSEQT